MLQYRTGFVFIIFKFVVHSLMPTRGLISNEPLIEPLVCNCTDKGCEKGKYGPGICETYGGCQKTIVRDFKTGQIKIGYHCIEKINWDPPERPIVCHIHGSMQHVNVIGCCNNYSFCAQDLNISLDSIQDENDVVENSTNDSNALWMVIIMLIFFALAILGVSLFTCQRRTCVRLFKSKKSVVGREAINPLMNDPEALESYQNMVNNAISIIDPTSSGSGGGTAMLEQRTISRQITLETMVGKGRFGEVWQASWRGDPVAVKVFNSRDKNSWSREVEIYRTDLLQHKNLLAFIGSDMKDTGTRMELWLVTQFHINGSLFDFILNHTIDEFQLSRMGCSVADGLAFLHTEFGGTFHKPAIAHRDIKSKNILVKSDFTCCLADLGLAVRYDKGTIDVPNNNKVGTTRYLSPEVLDSTVNVGQFDSYRHSDIYSLGLVFWELCRRTDSDEPAEPFESPYYEFVPGDPGIETMRQCVCVDNRRPTIPSRWHRSQTMAGAVRVMRECWASDPSARLTALRVKKSFDQLSAGAQLTASMTSPLLSDDAGSTSYRHRLTSSASTGILSASTAQTTV